MPSEVFLRDIAEIVSSPDIPWDKLKNAAVLITGATGLVGGVLVRAMSAASARRGLNLRIIAHGRDAAAGAALSGCAGVEFAAGDIREPIEAAGPAAGGIDYILHCAAITGSAEMAASPVDVISTAVLGTRNVLELAREKRSRGVLYLSSMEVYGQMPPGEADESDLGYLDLTNPRSSYPESKRLCENLSAAYARQYGLHVKIARLARTFGAGTPNRKGDMRIASQFARKALAGEDIELHTEGNSVINCCYTADAVRALLIILLKGRDGEAVNIANPAAGATVREMAELVANEVCGGRIGVTVCVPDDIERRGYAPDIGFRLNADRLMALGWRPRYGLREMFTRMLDDWRT